MGFGIGEKLTCGGKCMKWFLITFNFLVMVLGAAILGVALWIQFDSEVDKYIQIVTLDISVKYIQYALFVCMAVGGVLFLLGLLGCCGAAQESACLLCLYATLLIVIIVGMIGGIVLAILFNTELESYLEKSMKKQANTMVSNDTKDPLTFAWNTMQYELECCGGESYEDYYDSRYQNESGNAVPQTCCMSESEFYILPDDLLGCQADAAKPGLEESNYLYTRGCYRSAKDWMINKAYILVGVAAGVILFLILTVVFACCVRRDLNQDD